MLPVPLLLTVYVLLGVQEQVQYLNSTFQGSLNTSITPVDLPDWTLHCTTYNGSGYTQARLGSGLGLKGKDLARTGGLDNIRILTAHVHYLPDTIGRYYEHFPAHGPLRSTSQYSVYE
jgi:hypothetical protein